MDCGTLGFPVLHHLPSLLKLLFIELVMPSSHLILCCPLLLLPSIFPSIRVFSNESVLCIKEQASFNFMAAVTICSDFGAQENKRLSLIQLFPHLFAMK